MMIDTVLKRARKRHRFSITFVTPEPFLGHFGVDGTGASPAMVRDEFANRHIEPVLNARIAEVLPENWMSSFWPLWRRASAGGRR